MKRPQNTCQPYLMENEIQRQKYSEKQILAMVGLILPSLAWVPVLQRITHMLNYDGEVLIS